MLIEVSNTLTVENPTPEMVLWCKRNLTIPNPEYAKKSRMNLWLGNTPKVLSLYETRGTTLVLPFGTLRLLPKDISDKALFLSEFAAPVKVNYNADVPLYDYQETAVQAMVAAQYGILQSAAGSGKTQMGIALAARLGRRTLWLCHTLDLIKQSKERAKLYMSEDLMGTITEGKVNLGEGITFATIQTMCKLDLAQYRDYWDCIITDEVHRVSGSPTAVTQYQKVLNSLSARHKYGLSATVHRSDGMIKATYALVGEVAYKVPDEAVADKIMKVGIYPVGTGVQISREALNTDGTLNYTKLITYLTENAARNQLIADSIEQRPSLILSDRLNHLETLISLLPADMQKDAVMISGKMTTKKGKKDLLEKGFFTAPASTKYHGNYEGGLFDHSYMVARYLKKLTEDCRLDWQNSRSPLLVGMFHDLCKMDNYQHPVIAETLGGEEIRDDSKWEYAMDTLLKGHGDKSVMVLAQYFKLTEEEIMCIRYHMGAFCDKSEWNDYTRAVHKYTNVLWTHQADMLASHVEGV